MIVYGRAQQWAGPSWKGNGESLKESVYIFQYPITSNPRVVHSALAASSQIDYYVAHFTIYLDGSVEQHYDPRAVLVMSRSLPATSGYRHVWVSLPTYPSGSPDDVYPPREQQEALALLVRWLYSVVLPNVSIAHKVNMRGNIIVAE